VSESAVAPRRAWRVLAVLALLGLLTASLQRMDLGRAWAEVSAVRMEWLVLAMACYFAILPLWAVQWHLLAPTRSAPKLGDMFRVVATTSTVLNTTPMLVGEAAAVVLLVAHAGLDSAAAISVLAMDQLLVGLAKLTVLGVAASWAPLPAWMTRAILGLVSGLSLLGVGLLVAAWRHADVTRWLSRIVPLPLARAVGTFATALGPLRSPSRGGATFLLALLKKSAEVLAIVCAQRAFGVSLPLGSAVLVLAALNLATLLPVIPGNVGIYEAAVVLVYTRLGLTPESALGIAVVQHLCYFVALATPGVAWIGRSR
jgi:uncharacterized membrane protein YbhN (UPF0104 family)